MKYTFTEEQLNALIYEVMELASAGVSFEKWEAEERLTVEDVDAWYFYPIEGDPFCVEDIVKPIESTKHYSSKGVVLGNFWGGGVGSYEAISFSSNSYDDLIEQNEKALKTDSLDSGMGFMSLIGALLIITVKESVMIDEKQYTHEYYEEIFIGDMTQEQKDFLKDIY